MFAQRTTIKPTRVRDENEINSVKDDRPIKKPRLPLTTKSGLSNTTTVKRSALADVSNTKDEGKKVLVKAFGAQKTLETKRAALADVKNTTVGKPTVGFQQGGKGVTTAGRVIMKAKRKIPVAPKAVIKQAKPAIVPEETARGREEEEEPEEVQTKEEQKIHANFIFECRSAQELAKENGPKEEEAEPEEESRPANMDIEDSLAVNPCLSGDEMSTDEVSIDLAEDNDKKNRSVSELVEPMETLSCSTRGIVEPDISLIQEVDDVVEDVDAPDLLDEAQVVEYVQEIVELWREKERGGRMPKPRYMKCQRELNFRMRAILVDWILDICQQFTLLAETSFLAVQLLDRLLSIKEVSKARFQLIGIAALVIATKFEETRVPCMDDFLWISADAYSREELLRVEKIMLTALDWDLTLPTALLFLRRFSKAARSDSITHTLSKYLTELSLPEYKMLRFVPSKIAASAVYLARTMTNKSPVWVPAPLKSI